ncbi:MAG: pyridoxal phosphate-dependent aminotransferase [Bacteroidota bacterium]|nr:pyridoxal phosphate-dependent aminotransferase [Bacteroidota bacterium]MEC8598483.1 pyridoxal phosphate-dependent aminotransferase [Bacteroidota bacterium]
METRTSQLLGRLSESATIAMSRKARELKAAGRDIISLSLGEPDFDTPEPVKAAGIQAIEDNFTHYPPVPGYPEVRQAICDKLRRDNGLDYTADQIVISTGAKHSLMNVVLSLVDAGDEVILPAPYWVSYADMTNLAGGKVVTVQTGIEQDFKMTADQLRDALTDRTRIVMVNSPNNPSGSVYTEEEMAALAAVLREHPRAIAISDEIYEYINFTEAHASLAAQPGMMERTVTVNGVSKGFAMTGWRIGYIAAPQWIAAACTKLQGQFTSGASGISQKATEHAMNGGGALAAEMKAAFLKRRDFMVNGLKAIDGFEVNVPQGAFYIFPDVSALFGRKHAGGALSSGHDLAMYLLEAADVATVGGDAFGSPNCIRLSYAASDEQLAEALRRIERAVGELSA